MEEMEFPEAREEIATLVTFLLFFDVMI